ncbi:hypothetical protein O3M35_010306 [Rhynocoris fuscipes]|uniref:Transcription termination factor 3, mitochondrial n=1 Tax=Rhynocoris fuscipes TaxID=488301 RepID=A0AAW1D4K9_9HEMI
MSGNFILKLTFVRCIRYINHATSSYCTQTVSTSNLPATIPINQTKETGSPLDICKEDVSDYAPFLAPTYNIAAYVNKSPSLQQFIKLGVDLHRIEKKGLIELLLKNDFERDVKKYIKFLYNVGVPPEEYGHFFTENLEILKEDLDNLIIRTQYLLSKKFTNQDIVRIISKNPKWISHRADDIDSRLGFFQDNFHLTGDEVRYVVVKMPKLITYRLRHVEENHFTIKEEMGFKTNEIKKILLGKPKIFVLNRNLLTQRLDFIINSMKIPHEVISLQPGVVTSRLERIKQRHNFLVLMNKAQYDCNQPVYISLHDLVRGNDAEFCEKVAGTSVLTYNAFLKTL